MMMLREVRDDRSAGSRPPRPAFSLLEMLIVLAILSALTMAAVQSLGPIEQQARFDATQKTLASIRAAIVTDGSASGGGISGFVADCGRLPEGISLPDSSISNPLSELYAPSLDALQAHGQSNDLTTFGMQAFAAGSTVDFVSATVTFPDAPSPYMVVSRGWRGPYVQLPLGKTTLADGWGNDFIPVAGSSTITGTALAGVTTNPLTPRLAATTWGTYDYLGNLTGSVTVSNNSATPAYPTVLMFQPQADASNPVGVVSNPALGAALAAGDVTTVSYSFADVFVGPKVLCLAYSTSSTGTNFVAVGAPIYVNVKPRASTGPSWTAIIP